MTKRRRVAPRRKLSSPPKPLVDVLNAAYIITTPYLDQKPAKFETVIRTAQGLEPVDTVVETYDTSLAASVGHRRWCSYISAYLSATNPAWARGGTVEGAISKTRLLMIPPPSRRFSLREDV